MCICVCLRMRVSRKAGLVASFKPVSNHRVCVCVYVSRVYWKERDGDDRGTAEKLVPLKDPRVHHGGLPIPLLIRWKEKAGDVKEDGMW